MSRMEGLELLKGLRGGRYAIRYLPRVVLAPEPVVVGAVGCLVASSGEGWNVAAPVRNLPEEILAQLWRWTLGQLDTAYHVVNDLSRSRVPRSSFSLSLDLPLTWLKSEEWAYELLQKLDAASIPGSFVELQVDIGETPEPDGARLRLSTCDLVRNAGVALALKGFPSSPSSLVQLAHGKFCKVIIDRSMVPAMHESVTVWARKRELLKGLISLAGSVGAGVVIDGVDEAGQVTFLERLPQVEWQGAYWGNPVELSLLFDVRGRSEISAGLAC
jgi:EAL domain-containing protein (putative c-di-GMP-specific phosphodiesterase class I)